MDEEGFVSIKLSRKSGTFRGPFHIPRHLRHLVPADLRVEAGIMFPERKLKFELPKAIAAHLMKTAHESFDDQQ